MAAGRAAELHYEVATYDDFDGTSLTEITKAQDITVNDSRGEIVENDRTSIVNGTSLGQRTVDVSFNYHYTPGTDAVYTALRSAYTGDTTINVAVTDGVLATAGTRVLWFEARVASCPLMGAAPLEGAMSLPIKLVLANAANIEDATVSA